jgi:hypothetical protein
VEFICPGDRLQGQYAIFCTQSADDFCWHILRQFGTPHYLKIDIEGYDLRILRALEKLPSRPKYISVEECGVQIIDQLHRLGAHDFKLVSQRHPYPFINGSSGPFGEDTPGSWQAYSDFRANYLASIRDESNRWIGADPADWFDIHCRF